MLELGKDDLLKVLRQLQLLYQSSAARLPKVNFAFLWLQQLDDLSPDLGRQPGPALMHIERDCRLACAYVPMRMQRSIKLSRTADGVATILA